MSATDARAWAVFKASGEPGREDVKVAGPFTRREAAEWAAEWAEVCAPSFAGRLYVGRARTDLPGSDGRMSATDAQMPGTCWAAPLSRTERRALAGKLSRACKATWHLAGAYSTGAPQRYQAISASVEMGDLHMDVTERAEVPTP